MILCLKISKALEMRCCLCFSGGGEGKGGLVVKKLKAGERWVFVVVMHVRWHF